jgi:hypothetical protein
MKRSRAARLKLDKEEIKALLERYQLGKCTEAESQLVERWLSAITNGDDEQLDDAFINNQLNLIKNRIDQSISEPKHRPPLDPKTLIFFLCALIFAGLARGQVSGKLTAADGRPVAYATVTLVKAADSALLRSALSDEKGAFMLGAVPAATYILKVSCVGYAPYASGPIALDSAYDAGTIPLKAAAGNQLGEVVIRADKPLTQQVEGGLEANVQSSLMSKGSTVLQVLQRSPGVTLDPQTGAISLNGKSGVMVMLDGKLLRLSAAQVTSLLAGMTADDISKIELLATPPAKYDADGNAGLINIVTLKNKKAGTSGSLTATAGYGKGEKGSADLSLSHNSGKFSLHGSYSYGHDRSYGLLLAQGTENEPIIGGQTALHYNSLSKPVTDNQAISAGLDYRASPATTIGANVYYTANLYQTNSHNFGNYALADSNLVFDSRLTGSAHSCYLNPSLYLEQALGKNQQLNIDLSYIGLDNHSLTGVQSNFSDSLFTPMQQDLAQTTIKVGVGKLDYTAQINKKLKLESGLKGTDTRTESNSGIENLVNGQWTDAGAGTSSELGIREVIGAAYASLDWQPDSLYSLSAGARYEYSHNSSDQAAGSAFFVDRRLGKLFPSVFLTRKLKASGELQLSYTERISRPTFADLASYVTYNDPVSVFTGNPDLKPTITQNLKLAYSQHGDLFSLLYSKDTDPILGTQVMPGPTKGLIYLVPENADWQNNLTLQAVIPVKARHWWEMNYSLTGGWHQYRVSYFPHPLAQSYFSYSANFSESFNLPKNYRIELSGYYNSSSYSGNSRSNGNAIVNLGFKKELKNNKGSLQLSVSDVFRAASYYEQLGLLTTDAFNSNVRVNYQAESHFLPVIKLSYSRSFGSGAKKATPKDNGSKEEQERL